MPSSATGSNGIYTLSLHDALPICLLGGAPAVPRGPERGLPELLRLGHRQTQRRSEEHTSELQSLRHLACRLLLPEATESTLFPYTTLFRSVSSVVLQQSLADLNAAYRSFFASVTGKRKGDRKSTRLNSSHLGISHAVFCYRKQRNLHSFPTRRSSDLSPRWCSSSPSRT